MEVEVSGNFNTIIPQTKICRDFLKEIFQKEYPDRKKGQIYKDVCNVLQKQ